MVVTAACAPLSLVLQNDDPRVAETAVVGYNHPVFGQGLFGRHVAVAVCSALFHSSCLPL